MSHGIEIGEVDHIAGFVGDRGSGKTVALIRHILTLRRKLGAYCICSDARGDMPITLYDGTPTGVLRHADYASLYTALSDPKKFDAIHAVHNKNATPLISIATRLVSVTSKRKTADIVHASPVILGVDEMGLWEEADKNRLGDNLNNFLIDCRHLHVAMVYGVQSAMLIHYRVFHSATELHLFKTINRKDLNRLSEGGVPDLILDKLPNLPKYHSICFSKTMTLEEVKKACEKF